jgi:DNA-binding HxlR family transcriptional regulator
MASEPSWRSDVSPTVLEARLTGLRRAALVRLAPGQDYALTFLGREMSAALSALLAFSDRCDGALAQDGGSEPD